MAKKSKTEIDLYQKKIGKARRQEMLDEITNKDTNLPESILHEDMDKGMMEFVREQLKTEAEGKIIPVNKILFTLQRWAEFSQTWQNVDSDNNIEFPFIIVIRQPDPQPGTHPSLQYTIPDRKTFTYTTQPTWDGQQYGATVYKIPQPVPIDIEYEVVILCDKLRTLNRFNRVVLQKFASRQAYTKIKGHYIPLVLDNVSDESEIGSIEEKRFFKQVYKIRMEGFLIDENEFEIKPAINRSVIVTDIMKEENKKTKFFFNDVEVTKRDFVGDGTKTLFSTGEKIGMLLAVSVNGYIQTRGQDYFHNETTPNIIFTTPPANGRHITILYISAHAVKLYTENVMVELKKTEFIYSGSATIIIPDATGVLYVIINGQIFFEEFSFNAQTKELTVSTPLTDGDNVDVYYL
jgi:hypothetical protein